MKVHHRNDSLAYSKQQNLSGFCQPNRIHMLRVAGLVFEAQAASIDEEAIKQAGIAENIAPADIATTLAEVKAGKLASQKEGYIIGCDQLLSCEGEIFSKPLLWNRQANICKNLPAKPTSFLPRRWCFNMVGVSGIIAAV